MISYNDGGCDTGGDIGLSISYSIITYSGGHDIGVGGDIGVGCDIGGDIDTNSLGSIWRAQSPQAGEIISFE